MSDSDNKDVNLLRGRSLPLGSLAPSPHIHVEVEEDQGESEEGSILAKRKRKTAVGGSGSGSSSILTEITESSEEQPPSNQQGGLLQLARQPFKRHSLTPDHKDTSKAKEKSALMSSHSLDLGNLSTWRGKSYINLQNYWTGEGHSDRLHHQAPQIKDTGCHNNLCVGSQIWPKEHPRSRPYAPPRPKDEMKDKAREYIKMYYDSQKAAIGADYNSKLELRLNQVMDEIEQKGHYNLTHEELTHGARLAWRNAPRCVNRIVWRQLELLDARDCNTAKEMFEAICHHLKYATNGGNLRSTITIFKHRTKANSDFRVWNIQLIRYAGYKNSDGTITGDPDSVEFTEVCRRLGWVPPGNEPGMFHVLPLVLQANGGQPEWFDIPKELVLEVEISHPEYKWFRDLGLQWYALPAVANMLLDVGGLEFTACPFNGWYMSSEIGGRNFGDEYRYNMLKPVAEKMGLNTQTYKLWKDRALVEMNLAVLHSFQKANVSIVDHHTATEGFITFFKSESASRGGCPADWVWIVPPISGSCTKVFHQEMLLYYLSPSYEYQEPAWKVYVLPGDAPRLGGPRSFKAVASMVRDATRMMRTVKQRRIKCTILYATETGMSKNYACVVRDLFDRSFNCSLFCMDEYSRAKLEHEQLVLVVTSTFGSGDPPANGETFGQYLMDCRSGRVRATGISPMHGNRRGRVSAVTRPTAEQLAKAKEDMSQRLSQVKYAVFGLGSRAYPNFCAFAHTVDNLFMTLGAEQVYPCGEGDEMCGQEESFQSWVKECYRKACEVYHITPRDEEKGLDGGKFHKKENYRIKPYRDAVPPKNVCRDLSHVHKKRVLSARVGTRTRLQSANSDRSTILVTLLPESRMPYQPGDHLTIYPQNNTYLVNELLERVNLPCDPDQPIFIESESVSDGDGSSSWSMERRLPVPTTIRDAFTYYLDITTPPTPRMLQQFKKMATRKYDRDVLQALAQGGEKYEDWKYERFPNLPEVLNQFHSLKLDAAHLLMTLPLLQCRYYSISSSPKMYPNEIHVTVAVVMFRKRGGNGPRHLGVCSTWLNRLEPNAVVPCIVRQANGFHMPDESHVPIIMVGPGTGIAPFRGFWQERMFLRGEDLKKQLLSKRVIPSTPPSSARGTAIIPDTPANRLSIGSMGGPGGPKRRQFVSTVTTPMASMLEVQTSRTQAPVPDLSSSDESQSDSDSSSEQTDNVPRKQPVKKERRRRISRRFRSASDGSEVKHLANLVSARQSRWGTLSLYFGCRKSDTDYIYREEIKRAQLTGAITDVNVALSREPGMSKVYVQDLLKKNADSVVQKLIGQRGYFYVCGDVSMAADVGRTLQNILEENAAMSANEARLYIENMKDNGQYREDIFGVTLKTAEVTNRVRTAAKRAWRVLVTADSNSPMTPLSSRPPLTPTTPGFKRTTVTLLEGVVGNPMQKATSGSRLTSQPDMFSTTSLLKSPVIEEEDSNIGISITEIDEEDTHQILNPCPTGLDGNSFVSLSTPEVTGGQSMITPRHEDEPDGGSSRRAIRKIKSQSQVETLL